MMKYYGWGMPMRPFGIFGIIVEIIFWLLFGFLIVGVIKWAVSGHHHQENEEETEEGEDSALTILKKRYAKGEIDLKTFEKMRKDIS